MASERIVLTREQISKRVLELGSRISSDYAGSDLLVVGILTGAFIFTADLVRALTLEVEVDFIRVASYGQSTCSTGKICLSKDIESEISGRQVLLVEDIVDTGRTAYWLREHLSRRRPSSLRLCALLDKRERRENEITIDYTGFQVGSGFLVGYGLDHAGRYRQRPDILELT